MKTYERSSGTSIRPPFRKTDRHYGNLISDVGTVTLTTENLLLEQNSKRTRDDKTSRKPDPLETIANLSHDIFRFQTLVDGVDHLFKKCSSSLHLEHFHFYRFDAPANALTLVSDFSLHNRLNLEVPSTLPLSSIHGWCLQKGYEYHCSEALQDNPRWTAIEALRESELASAVFLTVPGKGRPLGVLAACTSARHSFGEEEIHFLKAGAGLLSAFGERMLLSKTIRDKEREILSISDDERKRISQELHDGLCYSLMALKYKAAYLDGLAANSSGQTRAKNGLEDEINHLLNSTQELARGMHPGFSKAASDLTAVLADLARNIEKQFRVACIFQCDNSRYEFPESVVNNLYRITQEAVLNGIKHGDARRIEIALARTGKAIQLAVKNDGTSFDPRKNAGRGMGLRIMNYRARAIGATVSIRGIQPPGTLLTCSLPL